MPPPLSKMGEWLNLMGIWFLSMCENRDMSIEFVPLMLVGSVKFVLDERRS